MDVSDEKKSSNTSVDVSKRQALSLRRSQSMAKYVKLTKPKPEYDGWRRYPHYQGYAISKDFSSVPEPFPIRSRIDSKVNALCLNDHSFKELQQKLKGFIVSDSTILLLDLYLTGVLKYERCYLSASQAEIIYDGLNIKPSESGKFGWRIQHMLCSRVVNSWRISRFKMSVGFCYHGMYMPLTSYWEHEATFEGCSKTCNLALDELKHK